MEDANHLFFWSYMSRNLLVSLPFVVTTLDALHDFHLIFLP
jgi:hypothetical protein